MADAGAGEKLKVFISYSRKDSAAFADELLAGLEVAGFAPFLDRHDIKPGEDWEARLGGLIAQSDTVVFVVSPEAVKSDRCVWEVDRTIELSKRLLPVIFKPVPEHDIPKQLSRLQFVRFDTGQGITRPLAELAEALRHADGATASPSLACNAAATGAWTCGRGHLFCASIGSHLDFGQSFTATERAERSRA